MKIYEIEYSQIKDRIDAEFYKYVDIENKLLEIPCTKLGDLLEKIVRDPMAYGFSYIENGIPYYRVDDLKNPFIGDKKTVFILDKTNKELKKTMLKNMDIIMAVRGSTIGRLGLYNGEDYNANISPNVIILRPKNKSISSYLAILLLSKIGKIQIEKATAGTGQPTITVPYLQEILVPNPSNDLKKEIEETVKKAFLNNEEAINKYKEAEIELNKLIGIEELEFMHSISFGSLFNDIYTSDRLDVEYYLPKYTQISQILEKTGYEVKKLNELCKEKIRKVDITKKKHYFCSAKCEANY